jgi:hypothetical protein
MQNTLFQLVTEKDLRAVERFRQNAESLEDQIENKRNPAITQSGKLTARKARIARGMMADADRLERLKIALEAMADAIEVGSLPEPLLRVRTKAVVETLLTCRAYPTHEWYEDTRNQLSSAGIHNEFSFEHAKTAMDELAPEGPAEPDSVRQLREKEMDLLGMKIQGYFPTPEPIIDEILTFARIGEGNVVLEPSAGKGNIADRIRDSYPGADLKVIELNYTLREILELKGYNIVAHDFMEYSVAVYDRIVMNPPFERAQEVAHVQHAYELLKSGGRLVSVMSAGPFYRSDKKSKAFREWLDELGGHALELPDGSFKESGTGVATRLVVIDRAD